MDTDTFKELTGSEDLSSTMTIDHPTSNSEGGIPEEPGQQSNHNEVGTFETGSTVVIKPFPSDAAGALICDIP